MATQLAGNGAASSVNYFQTDQVSRTRCRLQHQQELIRKTLQAAFSERYQQREAQQALREKGLHELDIVLQGLLKPMVTYSRETISQDRLVSKPRFTTHFEKIIFQGHR